MVLSFPGPGSMHRSPAQRLLALTMVLAFLAGTGRSVLGLHECLHHLGHSSETATSHQGDAGSVGGVPTGQADHTGHAHAPVDAAGVTGAAGAEGGSEGHVPGPCTCFGSCACACAPSVPTAGSLVALGAPPPPLPFLLEDADLVDPRLVRWDRPPATAPPSTLRVATSI